MPNIDLELVANTSYAILLASYIMRDILWLRVLTVISLCFEIPYYYFQLDPLWDGISWDLAFIAINVYWIARLVFERRPVHFTPEQKRLWETALHRLHPRHARTLFQRAVRKSVAANETLSTEGGTLNELALISEGKVKLMMNGKKVEELGPGHFVGSASFLEEEIDFPLVATIVAAEDTSMMTWKTRELRRVIKEDNQLSTAIEATLGLDIANMLIRHWKRDAKIEYG